MPAQIDGSGAVLDGLVEGQWAGAGQVEPGLLRVAVQHCDTGGGTGGALAGRESKEGAECEIIRDVGGHQAAAAAADLVRPAAAAAAC